MSKRIPEPIGRLSPATARSLHWLFTDMDGTITSQGMLTAAAYQALWRLQENGIAIAVVTGRPAGWCDLIARYWPVAGVIGENGSFYYSYDRPRKRMERVHLISQAQREQGQARLEKIKTRVLAQVPRCCVAADQAFRCTDLALDYCEDVVPGLSKAEIAAICRIIEEEGAVYKISDIHINCWYGNFDKLACAKEFVLRQTGSTFDQVLDQIVYLGDSPNDEPMFRAVPCSIGVANINQFLDVLEHPPAFITTEESGAGFVEAVERILSLRS